MKKVSRRSFLKVAGAVASVSALAACGTPSDVATSSATTDSSTGTEASSAASGEKTVITLWTFQRHDMDYVLPMLDEYNATNTDNIEVVYEVMTDDFDTNLDLAFQSNQAPDVFRIKSAFASYAKKDMMMPIDSYVTDSIKADYGDTIAIDNITSYDDVLYSIPYIGAPFRFVYNKDVFEKAGLDPEAPPTTMDEMVEYAKTITDTLSGEGIYGVAANLKNPSSALSRSVDIVAQRSDCFIYDAQTETYDFTKYFTVVDKYAEMFANGSFFPGAEGLDIDPMRAQFAAGVIGMYMSADWEVGVYADQFPTEANWAAAPVPTMNAGDDFPIGVSGGSGWALSAQTKNPEAAWKVMSLFYDTDFQIGYSENGFGSILNPAVSAVAKPAEKYGAEYFVLTDTDILRTPDPHNAGMVIEGDTYYQVAAAVIFGQKNSVDAVAELNTKYNDALAKAKADGTL